MSSMPSGPVADIARIEMSRASHSLWDRSTYQYHMTKYTSCDCTLVGKDRNKRAALTARTTGGAVAM